MMNCIIVGTGGFLGAVARYLIGLIPINPQNGFPNKNLVDQYYRSICDRTRSSLWRKERLESTIDLVLESWNLWWLHNIFLFRVRNQSVDGTRIGLVGSTLCCIERDRSNGCSIRITVYSGKIRFHFDARRVTMKNRAYYHLPGLFEFYELYQVFLSLFREHREYFYDCVRSVPYTAPRQTVSGVAVALPLEILRQRKYWI